MYYILYVNSKKYMYILYDKKNPSGTAILNSTSPARMEKFNIHATFS